MKFKITGRLVDIHNKKIFPAEVVISDLKIERINRIDECCDKFILPGLIDSHIHIESSMLTPGGFAELAVKHGTVAVVTDPHEIANVAGIKGVNYMINCGESVPIKFFFGAPSCVPATDFESSGARLDPSDIKKLLHRSDIYYLSEMMNYPGVIVGEINIMQKIEYAKKEKKPVDGHAPGLRGSGLKTYIEAGISTDHESLSFAEAEEKISLGMKIQIREGSAAKAFDLFYKLIDKFPDSVMICSDDMHPDDLIRGHINTLLSRGVKNNVNIFNLIRAASLNPALHYKLPVGILREGDYADLIIVKDLENFEVIETYINGVKVYSGGRTLFKNNHPGLNKKFRTTHVKPEEINLVAETNYIRIIEVREGEIYTGSSIKSASVRNGYVVADPGRDICKIVVVNKYADTKPSIGFISGFGLNNGAIAASVAHDSHNIVAVGVNENDICDAVNTILDMQGGLVAVSSGKKEKIQLEIAGLMTNLDGKVVAKKYKKLNKFAKSIGSDLKAPFMSLSFMTLLVIPELKIGDMGLFDVNEFSFTSVFVK